MPASARELRVPFFYTFGLVPPQDSKPGPHARKGDALPIELSMRSNILATHFGSTVKSPMEENGLAPFEGGSESSIYLSLDIATCPCGHSRQVSAASVSIRQKKIRL